MMTSRSEYRLLLRQDNAEERLTPIGYEIGLISEERYQHYQLRQNQKEQEIKRLEHQTVAPSDSLNEMLVKVGTAPLSTGAKLADLIRRPQVSYEMLAPFDPNRPALERMVAEQVEIAIKYEGYIKKQLEQVEHMRALERKPLPQTIDYRGIEGLRLEAREKLEKVRPLNIGQASRISGVSPADISCLLYTSRLMISPTTLSPKIEKGGKGK